MRLQRPIVLVTAVGLMAACRPSDVLNVPPPVGVETSGSLASQAGAEGAFTAAMGALFGATDGVGGVLGSSELLSDEFTFTGFTFDATIATIDARIVAPSNPTAQWSNLLVARSSLLLTVPLLTKYEPAGGRSKIGLAYALAGYAELLLAESFCGGTPLDAAVPGGGIQYGMPLTDDSLLGVAVAHFDSALAQSNGDPAVSGLARVGLGRALIDRGQFAMADTTVAVVPTSFVYNTELAPSVDDAALDGPNVYAVALNDNGCSETNVSDREGVNGLNFLSATDPRVQFDTTVAMTCDGNVYDYPTKFEGSFSLIPLASGVEARLIEAEAALQDGQPSLWAADLRALRGDSADTHIPFPAGDSLSADSAEGANATAQVDLMFRERAFWLFGTGTRLGDLRRLVRQYGRDQGSVYPTGPYPDGNDPNLPAPLPNYGPDVDFGLPLPGSGVTITNPQFKGCLSPTTTA